MRSYPNHGNIPNSARSLQPDQIIKDSPSLRVNDLLKWDKWSSFSRKFLLQQSTDELAIIPLISECQKAEEEMYQWVLQKINMRRE